MGLDRVALRSMVYRILGRRTASGLHHMYRSLLRSFRNEFTGEERLHLAAATALTVPGSTALDAGAHTGAWTIALSRLVGPEGSVIAFEPIPGNYGVLTRRTSRLRNVTLLEMALSSESGTSVILVPGHTCEPSTGAIEETADQLRHPEGLERLEIDTEAFDTLAAELLAGRELSFVKCDVEGHELAVLQGAAATIEANRPAVMIEILREKWSDGDPTRAGSAQFLLERGYRMALLSEDGLVLDTGSFPERLENFLFLPDDLSVERVFRAFRPGSAGTGMR